MSVPELQFPIDRRMAPGQFGAKGASPVKIARQRQAVAQITPRKGQANAVIRKIADALRLDLPEPGYAVGAGEVTAVWIAPTTWLVLRPWSATADLARGLAAICGTSASVVDQSAGKTVLRLSGVKARDVLAKGCRVDLHPRVFGPARAAVTPIAHIPAVVQQVDATPAFDLIVPSTLAEDFFEWLCVSAAEFGYEIQAG